MLPALRDLTANARVVSLPLVTRFRRIDTREAMLFEGPEGWTEFAPFVEYDDAEAAAWLAAQRALRVLLVSLDPSGLQPGGPNRYPRTSRTDLAVTRSRPIAIHS